MVVGVLFHGGKRDGDFDSIAMAYRKIYLGFCLDMKI
jgi:hypothetical protein